MDAESKPGVLGFGWMNYGPLWCFLRITGDHISSKMATLWHYVDLEWCERCIISEMTVHCKKFQLVTEEHQSCPNQDWMITTWFSGKSQFLTQRKEFSKSYIFSKMLFLVNERAERMEKAVDIQDTLACSLTVTFWSAGWCFLVLQQKFREVQCFLCFCQTTGISSGPAIVAPPLC